MNIIWKYLPALNCLRAFCYYDKPAFNITGQWNLVYDYESVRPGQVNSLVKNTETLCDAGTTGRNSTVEEPDYLAVLRDYQTTAKKVSTTLLILQIPVLALLLAFIFMISRQMLDLEQNEIALLKSRGSSRNQILLIYTRSRRSYRSAAVSSAYRLVSL